MKINKKLHFIIVALNALVATSSFAATPCKAYVRLDLGYSMTSGTRAYGPSLYYPTGSTNLVPYDTAFSPDLDERGMIGDLALGYAFNDAMRGEVSFDFRPKMQTSAPHFSVENQEYGGSAKVLYDFNNNTSVTPFLFGGLGALNIKSKIYPYIHRDEEHLGTPYIGRINSDGSFITDNNTPPIPLTYTSLSMPAQTVMTYQAGFGLAFKASEEVSIDCTYGLGGKTNYQVLVNTATLLVSEGDTLDIDTPSERYKQLKFKNQMDQSLTLGLRFTM